MGPSASRVAVVQKHCGDSLAGSQLFLPLYESMRTTGRPQSALPLATSASVSTAPGSPQCMQSLSARSISVRRKQQAQGEETDKLSPGLFYYEE